jgi:hypothetical protein
MGNYAAAAEPEINELGTPGLNLCGGYCSDGMPFRVQFLSDMCSPAELLALARDF